MEPHQYYLANFMIIGRNIEKKNRKIPEDHAI